jgi:molybdate transport system ATP-binding protein
MAHSGLHVALRCTAPVPLAAEFDCASGELVALVGPSGSGKTTLLRAIAGLYQSPHLQGSVRIGPAAGDVWFDSQQRINLAPQQRRAGLVFQQYALFPHLNAINNIALCLSPTLEKALKTSQAMALLQRVGLAELALRLPHELSGGQQQRVAIARALARLLAQQSDVAQAAAPLPSPAPQGGVLLLDEPFSAVDAPMRQVLYRELAHLHASLHVPIVLVTHDLAEARRLADRVVIMDAGRTLQSGPPERVLRSPRNARVAQLVGIHNHFASQFFKANVPANIDAPPAQEPRWGKLRWGVHDLWAVDKGKIDNQAAVTWVLAGDSVQVMAAQMAANVAEKISTHSDAAHDNYLPCQLTEMLPLGEICVCQLTVPGAPAADTIRLNVSTAVLRTLSAQVGSTLLLHMPPEALHIMPVREV